MTYRRSMRTERRSFVQQTADFGLGIDATKVVETLEQLEGPSHR